MAGMGRSGILVRAILQQLSGAAPPPAATQTSEVGDDQTSLETSEVSQEADEPSFSDFLNSLLQGVEAARQPNAPAALRSQLHTVTLALAQDSDLPPEIRALGQALHAILNGQQPDLTTLSPELAAVVQQVWGQS
jgi:hypothetical protein